jgi:hypothetical protein
MKFVCVPQCFHGLTVAASYTPGDPNECDFVSLSVNQLP